MKFSAYALAAGLLLVAAAAVPFSDLNPLVKTFGALGDNLLSETTKCRNLTVAPIGKIKGFRIIGCTKKDYPCHVVVNKSYIATTTFTCGVAHKGCRLEATINGMPIFAVPNDPNETIPVQCDADDTVTPIFPFTIPSGSIPGTYNVEIKLFCDDYYGTIQQVEFCLGVTAKVNAPA